MITLAFAQMIYYLSISIEKYGSDDGLSIDARSDFGFSLLDLNDNNTLYYLIFIIMVGCLYLTYRIVNSRFGFVIRGSKSNDPRMRAVGFPTYGYRLSLIHI